MTMTTTEQPPRTLTDWSAITAAIGTVRAMLARLAPGDTRELPRMVWEAPDFVESILDDAEAGFERVAAELRRRIDAAEPARLAREEARVREELADIERRREQLSARAARSGPGPRGVEREARGLRRGERARLLGDIDRSLRQLKAG